MRLIDADALLKASRIGKVLYFNDTATDGYTDVLLALEVERATTIEAEPVKHGMWINRRSPSGTPLCECSVCGDSAISQNDSWGYPLDYYTTDFCPNCGAKMDGVTDNSKEDEYE